MPDRERKMEVEAGLVAPPLICEFDGHEFVDAGGGLEICGWCEAERWTERKDPALREASNE